MASSFKKINTKVFARPNSELTPDNVYWKKYSAPVLVKEFGPIDYIDFSPVEPHYFAVTVTKNLSRFKEAAYGGSFRSDGKLLCAGGEEAVIRLFDVHTKSLLRLFSGHKAAIHRTLFTTDNLHIASFSDDKTAIVWDIPSEKQIISFNEHSDYIRAGAVSPISKDILLSGGYDKHIYMYDTRTNKQMLNVSHEAPVESLLFLPSGGIFLSAGGTEIRVWDALAGGKLLAKITQHHKTVTCLKIAPNGHRILSGSLDRHVKIYDTGSYKTVHSLDYPNSVLSIGISSNDETIVAGMVDGLISVRRREEEVKNEKPRRKKISYRRSGRNIPQVDVVIDEEIKEIMSRHDACLRKFEYSKALDCVMAIYVINKAPHVTVALMQELVRRQGLKQALSGRDGKSLVTILRFLNRYVGSIRFGRVLLYVTNALMDIYEDHMDELAAEPRKMFSTLAAKLEEEENLILALSELQGKLHMILSAAENVPPTPKISNVKDIQTLKPSSAAQKNLILSIA
ncbi:U3 small nucleolar RNA-associated protein 15 like protein [Melipona quadrifasciata]|uniref:U3 small nucleolar RNA-associated protein 15 homolog n=1 Tax=Melipona quadrifasciata TaxID=166423 RepID=A0A0N0BHN9_9HYME|nr:U3 small nucleolar RNA-associated protein 15 like protein [Melipona quadrifasciata]